MTVAVLTLAGRVWHLAADRKHSLTFCGRQFSDGLDEIEELDGERERTTCQHCQKTRLRRRRRGTTA